MDSDDEDATCEETGGNERFGLPQPILATQLLIHENEPMVNLISLYEQSRCLWDKEDDDYASRTMREEAWNSIYEYYRKVVIQPDEKRMKKTFDNMRHSWRRELRLIKARKGSGDKAYQPKLWYFDLLHFLHSGGVDGEGVDIDYSVSGIVRRPKFSKDFIAAEEEVVTVHHECIDISEEPQNPRSQLRSLKRPKVDPAAQTRKAVLEAAHKLMTTESTPPPSPDDPWMAQGKAWGQRLAALDSQQRPFAIRLMGEAMFYAEQRMLNIGSSILVNPQTSGVPQSIPLKATTDQREGRCRCSCTGVCGAVLLPDTCTRCRRSDIRISGVRSIADADILPSPSTTPVNRPVRCGARDMGSQTTSAEQEKGYI